MAAETMIVGTLYFSPGGLIVLVGLALLVVLAGAFASWWRERPIRMAKKVDIGDGVTLAEGIEAYFGTEGFWGAGSGKLGYVDVLTGFDRPKAAMRVYMDTMRIEVFSFMRDRSDAIMWHPEAKNPAVAGDEERQALLGEMVLAAKRRKP